MPFNELEKARIDKIVGGLCRDSIPDHLRSQIKLFYEIRGYDVKIFESRPSFANSHEWTDHPVARMKYDPEFMRWQLYWMKASGSWAEYNELKPTTNLKSLIDEIKRDPYHVFWG